MEVLGYDIAPEQIVEWLCEEDRQSSLGLTVSASRSFDTGELIGGKSRWLNEDDREGLTEVVETGLLEISPKLHPDRWTLRIRVEDDIGPRLPEDEPVPEGAEAIDLQTFADEFTKPGRGVVEVTLEAVDEASKADFERLFGAILKNRHGQPAKSG